MPANRTKGDEGMESDERYEVVCKPVMNEIKDMLSSQHRDIKQIHKEIFVGNGSEPMKVRLARGDEIMKQHQKMFRSLFGFTATVAAGVLVLIIFAILQASLTPRQGRETCTAKPSEFALQ